MRIAEITQPALSELKSYAAAVIRGGGVKSVWLIGSSVTKDNPRDTDLLYVLDGEVPDNPVDPEYDPENEELVVSMIERTTIESDRFDSFFQIGDKFWYLSWGGGASFVRNDKYARQQISKPKILLAKA